MIWFIFFILLLLTAGLLIWLPLVIEVDTATGIYRAAWQGIFGIRIEPGVDRWHWYYRILSREKEWFPDNKKAKSKPAGKPTSKKRSMQLTPRQGLLLANKLLRSIKINRFLVDWDTGDFIRNAYLYPIFRNASRGIRTMQINFFGRQELSISLQARPYQVAGAFLQVFFYSK